LDYRSKRIRKKYVRGEERKVEMTNKRHEMEHWMPLPDKPELAGGIEK
jgi:hypothetical protein